MSKPFYVPIEVQEEDIDQLQHVNNAVYVKWMDQVAGNHWDHLTRTSDFSNYFWVVSRHEIDYKQEAKRGDQITAKTWVGETKGVISVRYIEFYKEDVLLVRSKTNWVLIDSNTGKPSRIRENILSLLLPDK